MPTNIVDVDTFTDPVVVPVGTDSRNDAAGDVETLSQALANRTRNLKNRLDTNDTTHARRDTTNTFALGQTFSSTVSIGGTLTSAAINATGTISATVGVHADGDLTAGDDVIATNDITAGDDVHAGGEVTAGTFVQAGTGDFVYASARSRTTHVPLTSFVGDTFFSNYARDGIVVGAADIVLACLRLPKGAVINVVELLCQPAGASAMTFRCHRRTAANYTTPTAGTGSTVDTDTSSGTALQVLSVTFSSLTVAETEEYWISVEGAQAGDKIWGARIVAWDDPGPINI